MTQTHAEGFGPYRSMEKETQGPSPRGKTEKILKGKESAITMSAYGPVILRQYDGELRVHVLYAYPEIQKEHLSYGGKKTKDSLTVVLTIEKHQRSYSRVEGTFGYSSHVPVPPDFDPEKLFRSLGMEPQKIVDYSINNNAERRSSCIEEAKKTGFHENMEYPELYSGMTTHGFCQLEIQPLGCVVHLDLSPPVTFYIDKKGKCLNMITEKKVAGSWVDWEKISKTKTPFTEEKIIRNQYTKILDEALETLQAKPVGEKESANDTSSITRNIRSKLNL